MNTATQVTESESILSKGKCYNGAFKATPTIDNRDSI